MLPLHWIRTKWAAAAVLSVIPAFFLAEDWGSFFLIWSVTSVCIRLAFPLLPLDSMSSWIPFRRPAQRKPARYAADGELLARLRAEWLRPTASERAVAVILLLIPSFFHVALFVLGIAPGGIVTSLMQLSPGYGLMVVRGYRKRRRKKQAELNERAIELTRSGSEFILYLRSFNTSNRLRVKNTMPKTLDRLLVGIQWDIEYAFSHAFETVAPLVAIGTKGKGIGAAKIDTEDSRWEELFGELSSKARAILIVPSLTPGTRREIATIATTDQLLRKTIWVMPPTYWGPRALLRRLLSRSHRKNWEAVRGELKGTLELPPYRRSGALIYAGLSGREYKQYSADDLAEDRLRPLVEAVTAASRMDEDARARAIGAFSLPRRSRKYHLEEWIFRRWIAGLGSAINYDLLFVSIVIVPLVVFIGGGLIAITGIAPVLIEGGVMLPTILPGDTVLIRARAVPTRGDIVAIKVRNDKKAVVGLGIARLVGLPGDRIKIEHGTVYINGDAVVQQPADEVYQGELAEVRKNCLAEDNSLPEGVHFKSLVCGQHTQEDAAKLKAAQNVAELVVPPDKFCAMYDLRRGTFVVVGNQADLGGTVTSVVFSIKDAQENIFARIRWDRLFKPL